MSRTNMVRVSLSLTKKEKKFIDTQSQQLGISTADFVRRLIDEKMEKDK